MNTRRTKYATPAVYAASLTVTSVVIFALARGWQRGPSCNSGTFLPHTRLSSTGEFAMHGTTAEGCCKTCEAHSDCRTGFTFLLDEHGQHMCVGHSATTSMAATVCLDCTSFLKVITGLGRRQIASHLRLLEQLQPVLWSPAGELNLVQGVGQTHGNGGHASTAQIATLQRENRKDCNKNIESPKHNFGLQRSDVQLQNLTDIKRCRWCQQCVGGDPAEGGVATAIVDGTSICLLSCSAAGFCGAGQLYGTDCSGCERMPSLLADATQDCLRCYNCKAGSASDGGSPLTSGSSGDRCVSFCSATGFCGHTPMYRGGSSTDCRPCASLKIADVPTELRRSNPGLTSLFLNRCEVCNYCRDKSGGRNTSVSSFRCSSFCSENNVCERNVQHANFGTDCRPCTHLRHKFIPRMWGIVFPLNGAAGSRRLKAAKTSWLSLCRAMRETRGGRFHIIAVDDAHFSSQRSQEQWLREWRVSCDTPNLQTLLHVEGRKSIAKNMKMGYEWASQYHYIMNLDSGAW
eukprot:COSAG05_NODE_1032_length_6088_cov_23.885624_4_plen_517_part_00